MRPIDADALTDRMYHDAFESDTDMQKWDSGCWIRYKMFENAIDEAPSIDIEPKRGEWKPFDLTWGRSIWYCTACEESTEVPCDIWKHKPIYKYCPNCGADMRGADDE